MIASVFGVDLCSTLKTELLKRMLALVEEIMEESGRYFNLDREEYVEFEIKEL